MKTEGDTSEGSANGSEESDEVCGTGTGILVVELEDEEEELISEKLRSEELIIDELPTNELFTEHLVRERIINEEEVEKPEGESHLNSKKSEADKRGDLLAKKFTLEELFELVRLLKKDKVPGPDGVPAEFLRWGGGALIQKICEFLNIIREREVYPDLWGDSNTSLLFKGGDLVEMELDSYRGITLQQVMCKLFCRLLMNRMNDDCEARGVYGKFQFAYRKGMSGTDASFILGEVLREGGGRVGRNYHIAFLDLRKAFDSVNWDCLWDQVEEAGFGGKLLRLLKGLYANSRERVSFGEATTCWLSRTRGVHQGCVLSPLLFAIFVRGVLKDLSERGVGIDFGDGDFCPGMFFADDLVLFGRIHEEVSVMLGLVYEAFANLKLELNDEKSKILCMRGLEGEIGCEDGLCEWKLGAEFFDDEATLLVISNAKVCKHLGVKVQSGGGCAQEIFKPTGEMMIEKTRKCIFSIIDECSASFDRVYEGITLWEKVAIPSILFAAEICIIDEGVVKKLEEYQLMMARFILGIKSKMGVAYDVLRWELGFMPIKDRIALCKLRYWHKLERMNVGSWCSRFYRRGEGVGWSEHVKKIRLEYVITDQVIAMSKEVAGAHLRCKVLEKVMKECRKSYEIRIKKSKDGSWANIYKWRVEWGYDKIIDSSWGGVLLGHARVGAWPCGDLIAKKGGGKVVRWCGLCADLRSNLYHCVFECIGFSRERITLTKTMVKILGEEKWHKWLDGDENVTMAKCLGLVKEDRNWEVVQALKIFLVVVYDRQNDMVTKQRETVGELS